MNKPFTYKLHGFKNALFLMLFSFPVLPIKGTHLIFMLYALLVLVLFVTEKQKINPKMFISYGLLSLIAVPYLLELILFSSNKVIQFETEKKLLFLIAPFIFYADSTLREKNNLRLVPIIFILSVSMLSLLSLFFLIINGNLFSNPANADYAFQLRLSFETFSGLHPSYYGLFSTTAILWILSFYNKYSLAYKRLWMICLVFLILLNVLVASKMALIILITGIIGLILKFADSKNKKGAYVFMILITAALGFFFIPSLHNRFNEFSAFFIQTNTDNTLLERMLIFNCNKSIFMTDIFFGSGSRNTQALLDYCYTWCGYHKGALIHLNSHNQYFTFALNYGILYLMMFVGFMVYLYIKSKASILSIIFWFAATIMMLSESMLERQMGIYYFLFFALFFLSTSFSNQKRMDSKGI